jgi:predicted GNAT family acetyltransferase
MKQQEQSSTPESDVSNNSAQSRYELKIDGKVAAQAQYRVEGDKVRFTHTEVDPDREGQGLGSKLAAYALDDVRSRGLKAIPQCKFIAAYIARHEAQYGELVQQA